jgi:hypothetical protein
VDEIVRLHERGSLQRSFYATYYPPPGLWVDLSPLFFQSVRGQREVPLVTSSSSRKANPRNHKSRRSVAATDCWWNSRIDRSKWMVVQILSAERYPVEGRSHGMLIRVCTIAQGSRSLTPSYIKTNLGEGVDSSDDSSRWPNSYQCCRATGYVFMLQMIDQPVVG